MWGRGVSGLPGMGRMNPARHEPAAIDSYSVAQAPQDVVSFGYHATGCRALLNNRVGARTALPVAVPQAGEGTLDLGRPGGGILVPRIVFGGSPAYYGRPESARVRPSKERARA
jgi:hypothetical protein